MRNTIVMRGPSLDTPTVRVEGPGVIVGRKEHQQTTKMVWNVVGRHFQWKLEN